MNRHDEEEAWRQIVANYGERPSLEDDAEEAEGPPGSGAAPGSGSTDAADRSGLPPGDAGDGSDPPTGSGAPSTSALADSHPDDEDPVLPGDFVPPEPPPLPRPHGRRGLAWVGLLGSPLVLVLSVVLNLDLSRLVGLALAGAFVAGFCYLVATMSRDPRDPGDDGARL